MKLFSSHRTKRNTVFLAMLVWVFALASGMVNACLLEAPGKHDHVGASLSADAAHAHANDELAGESIAADHNADTDASKESCLKACGDGSNAQIKLQTGVDPADSNQAPVVLFAWNAAAPIVSVQRRFDELQIPIVGPPLRLRYSRLTL